MVELHSRFTFMKYFGRLHRLIVQFLQSDRPFVRNDEFRRGAIDVRRWKMLFFHHPIDSVIEEKINRNNRRDKDERCKQLIHSSHRDIH